MAVQRVTIDPQHTEAVARVLTDYAGLCEEMARCEDAEDREYAARILPELAAQLDRLNAGQLTRSDWLARELRSGARMVCETEGLSDFDSPGFFDRLGRCYALLTVAQRVEASPA